MASQGWGGFKGWGGLTVTVVGSQGWGRLTKKGGSLALEREGQGQRGKGEHPILKSMEAGCFVWPCFESSFRPTTFNKSLRKSGDLDGKYLMVVTLVFRELGLQHLHCCFRFLFVSFQTES